MVETSNLQGLGKHIAVLVSGGVDSSVAVHLLVEAGYTPTLFYIKIGMEDEKGNLLCSTEEDLEIITHLARHYHLPLEIVNLQEDYWEKVVSYTIEAVKRGLTPNPDIMCNKLIKFGCFEEKWGKDFDITATGHYATTTRVGDKIFLSTAKDTVKDQTYFLGQINYFQLSKLVFPIGDLLKSEVRQIATRARLPSASRKDSQGICFLGKIHYNDFIKRYLGEKPGKIVEWETGKIVGTHRGYWFHTIGQRRGLGLSGGPWFVIAKNIEENILYVSNGYDPELQYGTLINMTGFQYISENIWGDFETREISFKIRHTPDFAEGVLSRVGDLFRIVSREKIQGIAAGQFGVVYDKARCLCVGSGEIV
ncbi:MAG: tRNA 2-thiouridine(34) synthase MnmA [Bacteroidales bacterium]|jgi:tRNA-specific 2-thiouridylase|nr:tRNA 2-thiouridine(34) synthase MnmA [Bacteroidales bacterium]